MNLSAKIQEDLKEAMREKNEARLRSIRAIKSAILLALTEKGAAKELSGEQEIQLLQKLIKQRRDSLEMFTQQNRTDLARKEAEEIAVIEIYLPVQLSAEEVEDVIRTIIEQTGAAGMKDMGKVMGAVSKQLAGKADNKMIAEQVKALLS